MYKAWNIPNAQPVRPTLEHGRKSWGPTAWVDQKSPAPRSVSISGKHFVDKMPSTDVYLEKQFDVPGTRFTGVLSPQLNNAHQSGTDDEGLR